MADDHDARIVYPLCWYRQIDLLAAYLHDYGLLAAFVGDGFHCCSMFR